jgi:hypothetical protein
MVNRAVHLFYPKIVIKFQGAAFLMFYILCIVVSGNDAEVHTFIFKKIYTGKPPIQHHCLLTAICSSISRVAINRNNV